MDLHQAFKVGARRIAEDNRRYSELHKAHGIEEAHWKLLTQDEYWTTDQARSIRSILANAIEISMTIAGMPPIPMPGQYAAALIATVVTPCNWMVACVKAPDTFDAFDASGLLGPTEINDMTPQQLMGLVIAYGADYRGEPMNQMLPGEVVEQVKRENISTKQKKLS